MNAKTAASLIRENAAEARAATAFALSRSPFRSSQGFSRTNAYPAFWPRVPPPNPAIVSTVSTASFSSVRRWSETRASTACVLSSVLPGGRSTCRVHHALVLLREEAGRHADEQRREHREDDRVAEHRAHAAAEQEPDQPLVGAASRDRTGG